MVIITNIYREVSASPIFILYVDCLILSSPQVYEVKIVFIPILQIRKTRHTGFSWQMVTKLENGGGDICIWVAWLLSLRG